MTSFTTDPDADSPGGDFVGQETTASGDQYLELKVPKFDGKEGRDSYLVIGKYALDESPIGGTEPTSTSASGDDLLYAFARDPFRDDIRDRRAGDSLATPVVDYSDYAVPDWVGEVLDHWSTREEPHYYYSPLERQMLTAKIHKYVGWRDHTEGNRISTTRGDKIEVIGGNYKLIVLGRGSGATATDMSGGMILDGKECPGYVTSVNWRKLPVMETDHGDDAEYGWQWVEETVKGNVIERFHGSFQEEFYGDELTTIVGHGLQALDAGRPLEPSDPIEDKGNWAGSDPNDHSSSSAWDATCDVPPNRRRPKVIEKTYARRIYDYDYAETAIITIDKPKRLFDEYVGCEPETIAEDLGEPDTSLDVSRKNEPWENTLELARSRMVAKEVQEELYADRHETLVRADEVVNTHKGRTKTTGEVHEYWHAHFYEHFWGSRMGLFGGANLTLSMGARADVVLGGDARLVAPLAIDIVLGLKVDAVLGAKSENGPIKTATWGSKTETAAVRQAVAMVGTKQELLTSEGALKHSKF